MKYFHLKTKTSFIIMALRDKLIKKDIAICN